MRRAPAAVVAALVLLGAGACFARATTSPTPAPSTAPVIAPTGADLAGRSLEVAGVWSGAEQRYFERVLAGFTDRTGIRVRFTSTGEGIGTALRVRLDRASPPDVAVLPQPGLLVDLAKRGELQPIEALVGQVVDESYAPSWRHLGSVDGTLYGVWFKAANKSTVWYSPAAFRRAGVRPPTTWEELLRVARLLSESGVTPFALAAGDGWTLTDWFENVYIRTAGPEMYDRLSRHEIPWTHPTVKAALRTMAQALPDKYVAGGIRGAHRVDFEESVGQVFGERPKAAMVYEGDFVAGVITGDTRARLGRDADFFDFPAIAGSPPAVVGGGDVAVLLTDNPAGQELIRYLADPASAEIWARLGGFTSPNRKVDPTAYADPIVRKSAQSLTRAATFRFDLSDLQPSAFGATVGVGLDKLFGSFLLAPHRIDAVTAEMEAAAQRAFD
jgi:alpha-glucoside transport system substrate-binding protein